MAETESHPAEERVSEPSSARTSPSPTHSHAATGSPVQRSQHWRRLAQLYEAVLGACPDRIYIYDRSGTYLYASPAGAEALGLSPADVIGKHWRDLGLPSEIMERFEAHRETVFATGTAVKARVVLTTLAGLREYEWVVSPLRLAADEVAAVACVARDVTVEPADDHRSPTGTSQAEVSTGQADAGGVHFEAPGDETRGGSLLSEGQLRAFADAWPVLISYVDRDQRYRFNNKAYASWFGEPPEAFQGREVREVLGETAYERIRGYVEAALAGRAVSYDLEVPYRDGTRFVHAHYIPDRAVDGTVRGFFAIVSAVSAAALQEGGAEATLRTDAQSAGAIASTWGEVATEILHELGQPLTAIASYGEACLRVLRDGAQNRDDVLEWLQAISTQASRAREIVRRFRGFVRHGELRRSALPLNSLVQDVVRLAQTDIQARRVAVQLRFAPDGCRVFADRVLLEQALLNVICNAVEAMAQVESKPRRLAIETTTREAAAIVRVSDTGPGIAGEVRDCLFQAFVTTKPDGVGMGLAISRSIMEAHGGGLSVADNPTGGAAFTLTLPLAD